MKWLRVFFCWIRVEAADARNCFDLEATRARIQEIWKLFDQSGDFCPEAGLSDSLSDQLKRDMLNGKIFWGDLVLFKEELKHYDEVLKRINARDNRQKQREAVAR